MDSYRIGNAVFGSMFGAFFGLGIAFSISYVISFFPQSLIIAGPVVAGGVSGAVLLYKSSR